VRVTVAPVEHVTSLARWLIIMKDGTQVEVWSDGYSEVDDDFIFGALVDASPEEQSALDVTSRTPSNPLRVVIAVARFPSSAVQKIRST
jgi:hypothetical protein